MKRMLANKSVFAIALVMYMLCVIDATGQSKSSVLKKRDFEKIQYSINDVIERHIGVLLQLGSKDRVGDELENVTKTNIDEDPLYENRNTKIEIDYYSSDNRPGQRDTFISDYLICFNANFKTDKSADFIKHKIESIGLYSGEDGPLAIALVNLEFDGEYNGKKLSKKGRYFYFHLDKYGGSNWKAKISRIVNSDKPLSPNLRKLVVEESDEELFAESENDESYFRTLYKQGVIAMQREKYGKAYFCFSEAKKNRNLRKNAEDQILELRAKIDKNGKASFNDVIFDELKRAAVISKEHHNYTAAQKYLIYAKERNSNAQSIGVEIEELEQKIRRNAKVVNLYNSEQYNDAIIEANAVMKQTGEGNNSYLLLSLAKCYSKMNDIARAEQYYHKAVAADPTNLDIYKWRAEDLQSHDSYDEAIKAYLTLEGKAEDNDDPMVVEARSMISFCKGQKLLNTNFKAEALDEFKRACDLYPGNVKAWVYRSKCTPKVMDKHQFIDSAIAKDSSYAEAYLAKAELSVTDKELAISLYKKAIERDKRNVEGWIGLGEMYMAQGYQDQQKMIEAKKNFDMAIKLQPINRIDAYYKRGRCHYFLNKFDEAEKDYKQAVNNYGSTHEFNCDYGFLNLIMKNYIDAKRHFEQAQSTGMGKYGLGLTALMKDKELMNSSELSEETKSFLQNAFKMKAVSKKRVKEDFDRLGVADLLEEKKFRNATGYDNLN